MPTISSICWIRAALFSASNADQVRLFVINLETGEKEYWTEGWDQDVDHVVWKGDKLYFNSGIHATFHLWEMDMATKEIRQLTEGPYSWGSFDMAGGAKTVAVNSPP